MCSLRFCCVIDALLTVSSLISRGHSFHLFFSRFFDHHFICSSVFFLLFCVVPILICIVTVTHLCRRWEWRHYFMAVCGVCYGLELCRLLWSPANRNLLPQGHLKWILSLPPCLTHFFLTVKECLPAFCLSPSPCFSLMPYWTQGSSASTQSPWGSAPNKGFLASPQFYRSVIWDVRLQVNSRCLPTSAFGFYPFRWLSSLFCYGAKHVP